MLNVLFIIFREGEGEREGKKHQRVVASYMPPTGDLARNPDMCPEWEWNRPSFDSKVHTQSTQSHQPGQK